MSKIVLPTAKSIPKMTLSDMRILLHGWPKSGKSTLAAYCPNTIFLKTERGTQGLSVHSIPEDPKAILETWDEVSEAVDLLKSKGTDKFDIVVIDTLDELCQMITKQVALDHGVEHISKLKWGQGWDEAKRRVKGLLEAIYEDFGVILISHSKSVEESRGAVDITRIVPSITGSMRDVITGWVDQTIYLDVRNVQIVEGEEGKEVVVGQDIRHFAVCRLTEYIEAGGRLHHMPEEFVLGETPSEGFAVFNKYFEEAARVLLAEYAEMTKPKTTRKRK